MSVFYRNYQEMSIMMLIMMLMVMFQIPEELLLLMFPRSKLKGLDLTGTYFVIEPITAVYIIDTG